MSVILGVDTSCYTTSLALVSEDEKLLSDQRRLLRVPLGTHGLRQSEAFFQHVNNLPELADAVRRQFPGTLAAVAATLRPRPHTISYLPVFRAGAAWGKSLASILQVPFFPCSHQENHLRVGCWSAGGPDSQRFIAMHLSGGTTEVLLVENAGRGYKITVLGKSIDLHAGQFIDRFGVAVGLPFPAGRELERLAEGGKSCTLRIPSSVKAYDMSFSGPLTAALQAVRIGVDRSDVAVAVLFCIAKTAEKVLRLAADEFGLKEVLMVGGVAGNEIIRNRLRERLQHRAVGLKLYFATPAYSTDNAVGTALLGIDALK